jgi:hypothetical protein
MHQLGIHEKVVVETSSRGEVTLLDDAYDFDEQSYRLIDPLRVAPGDRVRVECTHRNTTEKTVTFGESTLAEMCFAGLYRYPSNGSFLICSTDLPRFPFRPDGGADAGPQQAEAGATVDAGAVQGEAGVDTGAVHAEAGAEADAGTLQPEDGALQTGRP